MGTLNLAALSYIPLPFVKVFSSDCWDFQTTACSVVAKSLSAVTGWIAIAIKCCHFEYESIEAHTESDNATILYLICG